MLHPDKAGWARDGPFYKRALECYNFAEAYQAYMQLPGEAEHKLVEIGVLLRALREVAGVEAWSVIHNENGLTSFVAYGISIKIVERGAALPGEFAGVRKKLAQTPAAAMLLEAHKAKVISHGIVGSTYVIHEVGADGRVKLTSPPLARQAMALWADENCPELVSPPGLMCDVRAANGIASRERFIATRALGIDGADKDVFTMAPINDLQGIFKGQVARPPSGKEAYAIILTDEGYELWRSKVPDAQEDSVPHGFERVPGHPELLWTGLMARQKDAYGLVRNIFDGEPGCTASKTTVQSAKTNASGSASCKYFTAHYDSGAGQGQVIQQTGGGPKKK